MTHLNTCDLVGFRQGYAAPAVCSCGADKIPTPADPPAPREENEQKEPMGNHHVARPGAPATGLTTAKSPPCSETVADHVSDLLRSLKEALAACASLMRACAEHDSTSEAVDSWTEGLTELGLAGFGVRATAVVGRVEFAVESAKSVPHASASVGEQQPDPQDSKDSSSSLPAPDPQTPAHPAEERHGYGCPQDGDPLPAGDRCAFCCEHGWVDTVQGKPCPKCFAPAQPAEELEAATLRLLARHAHPGTFYPAATELMLQWLAYRKQAEADRLRLHADLDQLRAENEKLKSDLEREEQSHLETIDERDAYHDAADKLAYAIAGEDVIGEHSNMNDPWENAVEELDNQRASRETEQRKAIRFGIDLGKARSNVSESKLVDTFAPLFAANRDLTAIEAIDQQRHPQTPEGTTT